MQVFNLPSSILGPKYMQRVLTASLSYDGATGSKELRGGRKRVSASITLLSRGRPGSEVEGLPEAVVRCPEVAAAIAAGHVEAVVTGRPEPLYTTTTKPPKKRSRAHGSVSVKDEE